MDVRLEEHDISRRGARRYEVDCWSYVPDRPTHLLSEGAVPSRPGPTDRPPRGARRRNFWVGAVRPTDRRAQRGEENQGRNGALHCRAERGEEKSSRSGPTDRPPRGARRKFFGVGKVRPTDPLRAVVGDVRPTINFVPPNIFILGSCCQGWRKTLVGQQMVREVSSHL